MRTSYRVAAKSLILMVVLGLAISDSAVLAGKKDDSDERGKPWLGVYMSPSTQGKSSGVRILSVIDDSPAEKAGFRDGDVIVMFNRVRIEDQDDFFQEFRSLNPDDSIEVIVLRGGDEEDLEVVLGERSGKMVIAPKIKLRNLIRNQIRFPETRKRGYLGVHLQEMTDDLREYFDVPEGEGVLISKVEEDSPAGGAGLKAGDVITDVDGEVIENSSDIIGLLRDKEEGDPIDVTYYRDGRKDRIEVTSGSTQSQVVDMNTFIWCDKDEEDCQSHSYSFNFDNEGLQKSMEKLHHYFNSEDFQEGIQEQSHRFRFMESELERKMEELERKLEELEKRLQELREKEET